ncbi:MAG TPA: elongation factor G [Clostridiales bacterium]|nr:elongation factor G [Clostridiales bacterium]
MSKLNVNDIRNVAIIGHGSEGKTTLTEAMLFNAGVTDRLGRVEDGTTTTDYDPEEIKRQISISAALAPLNWNSHKINVLDVPGYFDFAGEVIQALTVADGAVIVVGAVSGVAVGTEKAWNYCDKYDIPRVVFINQLDREHVNFMKVLEQLKDKYGSVIAPFQVPIMEGDTFKGYVDIINMLGKEFTDNGEKEIPIPDNIMDTIEPMRTMLVEAVAETSEELMEKYFDGEEFTSDEIYSALRQGVIEGEIVPVLCGSAVNNLGVTALLDTIVTYMPSPAERPAVKGINPKTGEEEERTADPNEPFSAFVFKTVIDPFVGKLSLFKVISGKLTADTELYNANKDSTEKINSIYFLRGKKQIQVDEIITGDIGAIAKLQVTETGDTLCEKEAPIIFPQLEFPEPAISLAIEAEKEGEEDKVMMGLNRLAEEDPTFSVIQDSEMSQTLVAGVGELHLEVIASKLKSKFGSGITFKEPRIPYRETIRKPVKAEGKHKKQTGGHGQYGHVWIDFEPIGDVSIPFEFVDKIVGGVVPRQYIPAVEKGLQECLRKGVLAGYPMVGIRATLYDGSYHSVDSSEMAFKMAAALAYRKLIDGKPVLLEPIMKAEVVVPDEYMGDVIGDLNRRRGRILGMTPLNGGLQKVEAEVPQAEMTKYATDLRSMTQARGEFKLSFVRYEEVPENISSKIIEEAKKAEEE